MIAPIALIVWVHLFDYTIGPYDTGFRFPTRAACDDARDVIDAAAADARQMIETRMISIFACAPTDVKGRPT